MPRLLVASVLFLLAAASMATGVLGALPRPVRTPVVDTSGHETPLEGALYLNGFNIEDFDGASILDTYRRFQDLLGQPISGFDGSSQSFTFGRLTYLPGNAPDWQVQLDNVGLEELQLEGYTPKPGATPHPAVRDWLVSQYELGTDLTRAVGRIISDPICNARNECKQYADKQEFLFSRSALTADQVQRAPLGVWLAHPQVRYAAETPTLTAPAIRQQAPALVLGAFFALLGLAVTRGRPQGGSLPI